MKEYLPFLIGAALVLFQFYNNFKKEQEKARKRNPSQPRAEGEPDVPQVKKAGRQSPAPVPSPWSQQGRDQRPVSPLPKVERKPEPVLVKETFDPHRPYEPTYKREYQEPLYQRPSKQETVKPEKVSTMKRVEISHLEDISQETLFSRSIHQPHLHGFKSFHHEDGEVYEFDMRDAIIKEAILNRPQH